MERLAAARGLAVEEAAAELLRAKQPMRRFSTPEGIGARVAFLCGGAAAAMTGAAVTMDGGWVSVEGRRPSMGRGHPPARPPAAALKRGRSVP